MNIGKHTLFTFHKTEMKAVLKTIKRAVEINGSIYVDNGSNILGIAHFDTVEDNRFKPDYTFIESKHTLHGIALDDRLGIHAMINLLPEHGIKTDWLFTDFEECMSTTGADFTPQKEYNWLYQFDRAGFNPVAYQYEDEFLRDKLAKLGIKLDRGSYSDICDMEHLKVKAVNFGIGYHGQHTWKCFASHKEIKKCINQFVGFYRMYKDVKLPHTPKPPRVKWSYEYIPKTAETYANQYTKNYGECKSCATYDLLDNEGFCYYCHVGTSYAEDNWGNCRYCGVYHELNEFGVCLYCEDIVEINETNTIESKPQKTTKQPIPMKQCQFCGVYSHILWSIDRGKHHICYSCADEFGWNESEAIKYLKALNL
jgi:hypothetical protein